MAGATAPEARTRPLEQPSGVPWDLSDPADPLNIGMGWGTGGHGLGL